MKYANDIIKEIEARGPVKVPEDCFTSEDFDIWIHKEIKGDLDGLIQEKINALKEDKKKGLENE